MNYILKKIETLMLYVYIFLIVAFPTSFIAVKQVMSFVFVTFIILSFFKKGIKNIKIPRFLLLVIGLYVISGLFWIFVGIVYNGFQAPLTRFNVYVVNPSIYFFLILYIFNSGEKEKRKVLKAVEFAVLFIVVYNAVFFVVLNLMPFIPPTRFPGIRYNFGGLALGFKKITAPNLVTLAFFIPFYLVRLISRFDRNSFIIVVLGTVSAVVSARTALMLGIGLAVVIFLILNIFIKMPVKRKQVIWLTGVFGTVFLGLVMFAQKLILGIFNKIYLSFFSTSQVGVNDNGSLLRTEQINDLIRTWTWKPMLGWGEGANSLNIIRSNVSGSYEMTYFALLMQRGLVGTAVFIFNIWLIVKQLFVAAKQSSLLKKKELYFSTLVGFISILFANATNPTIQSFDGLFLFFFPVCVGVFATVKQTDDVATERLKRSEIKNTRVVKSRKLKKKRLF